MLVLTPIQRPWGASPLSDRLRPVLESWRGTPYMIGAQAKGEGVDCIRFVTGVLDELIGKPAPELDRLPKDAELVKPERMRSFMRLLISHYALEVVPPSEPFQPGDLLAVGQFAPGHVVLVGADRNTTWEASDRAVIQGGWYLTKNLFGAYRCGAL